MNNFADKFLDSEAKVRNAIKDLSKKPELSLFRNKQLLTPSFETIKISLLAIVGPIYPRIDRSKLKYLKTLRWAEGIKKIGAGTLN